jgi:hypothetical protein
MNNRMKKFRGKYEDVKEANISERHFIIIDEGAQLSSKQTKDRELRKVYAECEALLEKIAALGAGLGYRLIYATQYPLRENLLPNVKINYDAKLVFHLQNDIASRVVMNENGAEKLPRKEGSYQGGKAIYMTDAPLLVQTPFITNDTIDKLIEPYKVVKTMNTMQKGQERKEQILLSLEKFGFLSTSELQKIHSLGSYRNACRLLANMKEYTNMKSLTENVYYLNKKGREMIGSDQKVLSANMQINHILMRNELYIYMHPKQWQIERPLKDTQGNVLIKPDALFLFDKWMFIEIDNTQKLIVNKKKVERYAEIKNSNILHKSLGYFPQLVFLTKSDNRKERLVKMCRENNVRHIVYTVDDIK